MSALNICSLTQKPLINPVASLKSGHIYEKQQIIKHLTNFPYCPLTNVPMEISDLIQIKSVATSKDSSEVSLSNMVNRPSESLRSVLSKLQDEYDTLVLETHTVRKALGITKQQLAHSVCLNEAANRVIAKLYQQKKQTEEQLQKLAANNQL